MQNTWWIGRSCKRREAFRRAVLIGRALAPILLIGRAGPGTDGSFASVAMRPPGSPWFRHAGESALHERDHRGGDHPIPFRTRQLSPPSPKVLQRQAAGGQGVALMQGASAYIRGLCPFFVASFGAPFTRKYRRCGGFILRPYFSELKYNSIVSRIQRGWFDELLAYSRGRRPA